TLLLIGAAPKLGFQSAPPGELGDLSAPPVLVVAGILWLIEVWAERRPISALSWNLAQGVVRALAGALLALLLIPDASLWVLALRRWSEPARFPGWVTRALSGDVLAPGGGLRGAPAGALAHPDLDVFQAGWVVVRGGPPVFLFRRTRGTRSVELGPAQTVSV